VWRAVFSAQRVKHMHRRGGASRRNSALERCQSARMNVRETSRNESSDSTWCGVCWWAEARLRHGAIAFGNAAGPKATGRRGFSGTAHQGWQAAAAGALLVR